MCTLGARMCVSVYCCIACILGEAHSKGLSEIGHYDADPLSSDVSLAKRSSCIFHDSHHLHLNDGTAQGDRSGRLAMLQEFPGCWPFIAKTSKVLGKPVPAGHPTTTVPQTALCSSICCSHRNQHNLCNTKI